MLQRDLAAAWQERDQHRYATAVGTVDLPAKFGHQKAFLRAGLLPHTKDDEHAAKQRSQSSLGDRRR